MQCNSCGNQNNEDAKFCKHCGQKLECQKEIEKGSKKTAIVTMVVILLIFIVGGYIETKPRISKSSNQTANRYEETLDRGNKYMESMDYKKAELEYLDAINIEPKNEEAYVELSELYVVWEKPEEAKKIIAEGIANVPAEKQQKLPEKEEETAEYQSYSWVTEPTIEADDIYYVRQNNPIDNQSKLQMGSTYAVIKKGDSLGLINFSGELKAPLDYVYIYGGDIYRLIRKEAKYEEELQMDWDLYGLEDDEVIPISYNLDTPDWYYYFENGLQSYYDATVYELETPIPVQKSDKLLTWKDELTEIYGLYGIYSQGRLTTDFIYDNCGSYSQGLMAAKKDDKWGYVDSEGEEVIPFEYDASVTDSCYAASGGFVVLCKEGSWELRNTQGKVVLPAGYFDAMRPVYEYKCWVKKDGKWGVIQIGGAEAQVEEDETLKNKWDDLSNYIDNNKQKVEPENDKGDDTSNHTYSTEEVKNAILDYYNSKSDEGEYIIVDDEFSKTETGYTTAVRYAGVNAASANVLYSVVTVDTSTGLIEDDWGNVWYLK